MLANSGDVFHVDMAYEWPEGAKGRDRIDALRAQPAGVDTNTNARIAATDLLQDLFR